MDVQQSQAIPSTPVQPVAAQPTSVSVQAQPLNPSQPVQPTTTVQPPKRKKGPWWIFVLAIFILAGVGGYFLLPSSSIVIPSQPAGSTSIHVTKLDLAKPGWLLISRVSVTEGVEEIAVSAYLEPEEYTEFDLPLMDDSEPLQTGYFLYGTLYEDTDGGEYFDSKVDQPMKDWLGRKIRTTFRVL